MRARLRKVVKIGDREELQRLIKRCRQQDDGGKSLLLIALEATEKTGWYDLPGDLLEALYDIQKEEEEYRNSRVWGSYSFPGSDIALRSYKARKIPDQRPAVFELLENAQHSDQKYKKGQHVRCTWTSFRNQKGWLIEGRVKLS